MIQTASSSIKLLLLSVLRTRFWVVSLGNSSTSMKYTSQSCRTSAASLLKGNISWPVAFIAICMMAPPQTSYSQTTPTAPTQELADQSNLQIEGSQKSREELRRELQRLEEAHGRSQSSPNTDSVNGGRRDFLAPYRPLQDPEITPPDIAGTSVDTALASLKKRIEMLNQAMKKEALEPGSPPPSQTPATAPNGVPNPQPTEDTFFPSASPSANEMLTPPPTIGASSELNEPTTAEEGIPTGEPVLPSPINTFEVANSLFQTGSVAKALEYYQAIENESRSEHEQFWYQYFVASCLRQGGDRAEAAKKYRDLASSGKTSFPVESAKWWLSHMEQIKTSKEMFQQIDAQINLIAQELEK